MDRQPLSSQHIRRLMDRGQLWEIFGFSGGDFTALELAKRYSALTKVYRENPEDIQTIDNAFAILNAPMTRQFYEGCRMVMQRVKKELGDSRFTNVEDKIWLDLWGWVSQRWQPPTEGLVNAIRTKYSHSSLSDTSQTETWSEEELKPADFDSVIAAEKFAKEIKCQSCGKFDHTLRAVAFPYVVSILIVSFRRASEAGIFCHRCRCTKSLKWAIVSLLFGWWSIWGFFWNIGALVDNFGGGKMPRENNLPLIGKLAWAHMVLGKIAEAKTSLRELLKYGPNEEALQLKRELDTKYPEVSPAKTGGFRLGYLTVVFAILGVYAIIGINMFGGTSTFPTTPSQVTPKSTSSTQMTPTPSILPSPSQKADRSSLLTQITTNKARLSELDTQINAIDTELNGYKSQMNAISSRYPSRQLPEPYYSQYNGLVRQFNSRLAYQRSLIDNYNSLLQSTNALIDQYNLTR